ncbi:unnamed protein product [Nyctereutes procyonoides]|uniref:(raccoon dog) hypothetical protein n=1 Tax=Nyctereutes procyonoides TaxID=34880 RepID=A0A811Z766_NYCPR|nr:unnamed protein product [Nyctereutes procyonoides]
MEGPPGYGAEQGQPQEAALRASQKAPPATAAPAPKPQLPCPLGLRKATASWRQVLPGCPWTGAQPRRRAAEPRSPPARPRAAGSPALQPAPRPPERPATASPLPGSPHPGAAWPSETSPRAPAALSPGSGAPGQGGPADAAEAGASLERWSRAATRWRRPTPRRPGGGRRGPPPYLRAPGRAQAPPPGSLIRQRSEPTWHRPGDSGLQRPGPAAGPGSVAQEPRAAGPAETGDRRERAASAPGPPSPRDSGQPFPAAASATATATATAGKQARASFPCGQNCENSHSPYS